MTDVLQNVPDDVAAATKADVAALEAKVMAVMDGVETMASASWHAAEAQAARLSPAGATDFTAIWAHKTLVLFDVVLIAAAFVAGHYL